MEASGTGGVKPMTITGRTFRERERLSGMSVEERAWRAQWLKDQVLSHDEPRYVPEYWKEIRNPIRRFYQAPLNAVHKALTPIMGWHRAYYVRFWAGKAAMGLAGLYATFYYFKYNQNDWTRKGGWRVIHSKKRCVPGDEGYPKLSNRNEPGDYAQRGFKNSPI